MKTVRYVNPEARLRGLIVGATTEWVQTCHSVMCGHVTHDPGYRVVTGQVQDHVETAEIGGTVKSHPLTIRVDDAAGRAKLAEWRAMTILAAAKAAAKALRRD